MSNSFTLDDIRAAAEAKYGATKVTLGDGTVVSLRNVLSLPKADRDDLLRIQEGMSGQEDLTIEDQLDAVKGMIRIAADTRGGAEQLLRELDEPAALITLFEKYLAGTSVGEA